MRKPSRYIAAAAALLWLSSCGGGGDEGSWSLEDLKSDNALLQMRAIDGADSDRAVEAVPELVRLLKDSGFEEVRLRSVVALGNIGSQDAVPALIEVLNDPALELRRAAVTALGKLKNPDAIKDLQLVDGELELGVIWALGNIGDKRAIPFLNDRLASEDPYVRYNAAKALENMR